MNIKQNCTWGRSHNSTKQKKDAIFKHLKNNGILVKKSIKKPGKLSVIDSKHNIQIREIEQTTKNDQ